MAVSLPWPQTSLTGKNSLDNRMGVPGPIRRARASKAVSKRNVRVKGPRTIPVRQGS